MEKFETSPDPKRRSRKLRGATFPEPDVIATLVSQEGEGIAGPLLVLGRASRVSFRMVAMGRHRKRREDDASPAERIDLRGLFGKHVQFQVKTAPDGTVTLTPIRGKGRSGFRVGEVTGESPKAIAKRLAKRYGSALPKESAASSEDPDSALAMARARGKTLVAEILAREDMLTADEFANFVGTTRMTINVKRRNRQVLALEGAKRGYRFPRWQVGRDGKPFADLPVLFDRLGGDPWSVYRFLVQHHPALGGLTGAEALRRGRSAQALQAAEGFATDFA